MSAILARPRGWLEYTFLTVGRYNITNIVFAPKVLDIFSVEKFVQIAMHISITKLEVFITFNHLIFFSNQISSILR